MKRLIVWTRDVSSVVSPHAPGAASTHTLRYLALGLVVVVVGVLHRNALTTPWADDRGLTADPLWFQLGAPLWHAAIPGSVSIGHGLTQLLDPLTSASTMGDTRAIAALLAGLGAAALLMIFQRIAVPFSIGALLCLSLASAVLPTAALTSAADAVQALAAAGLLLTFSTPHLAGTSRLLLLSAITLVGTLNHAAFVAFAAGVWAAECFCAVTPWNWRTVTAGVATVGLSLLSAAWLLQLNAPQLAADVARPGTLDVAIALVTGRFAAPWQPVQQASLRDAVTLSLPGPLILCLPLALLGCLAVSTRRMAAACVLSGSGAVLFSAGTWLPDVAIATAPARVSSVILMAMGVTWLFDLPVRGSRALAMVVCVFIGLEGFVGLTRPTAARESAEVQAFTESAREYIGGSSWSSDRLAVARAMLLRGDDAFRSARVSSGNGALRSVPADRRVVALTAGETRLLPDGTFVVPRELAHRSAAAFLASQPRDRWLAVALRGPASGEFCRELLDRLGAGAAASSSTGHAVLARLGNRVARVATNGRLALSFGELVDGHPAPAQFDIETSASANISINRRPSEAVAHGMVLMVFDPWRAEGRSWVVGDCARPALPTIADRRLRAGVVVESNDSERLPDVIELTSTPITVPLGEEGTAWFAEGWHGPEAPGANAVRWTGARDANVTLVVAYQQPLRVELAAHLAERMPGSNHLSASWNGSRLPDPTINVQGQREWTIPKLQVRRGPNVLTLHVTELVSPAAVGIGGDERLLGAAVSRLAFVPIADATAVASSTGRR